ncbi:site-specific integrase [Enterococcus sp. SMC-9]|uniref:site-specific integrase n=1 Tax=Enterococcus sp. SMC-9 TaxID=2862343 RepID=UPI001E40FBCA|nr:site-specific integrase [Enterococcus sp. SMC-9]MCD1023509.1 site-specific integrase [Enterococcus sp. SMC-9]
MATFKEYKLKNGTKRWMFTTYLGTDYVTGKQINTTRRGFSTKKEAQYALNQLLLNHVDGVEEIKSKTTFKEVYDLWFPNYQTTVRESTWMTTDTRIKKYIIPIFGEMIFERIDTKTAQKTVNDWAKKFGMYSMLLSYVKRIGDYAVTLEVIDSNPFRKITSPKQINRDRKKSNNKDIKYYSKEELKKFLEFSESHIRNISDTSPVQLYYARLDNALFRLMAYSGARIGEILSLTWNDVNFKENTLDINKTLSKTKTGYKITDPKNDASFREIILDTQTMNIIKKWRLQQKEFLLKNGITKNNSVFTDIEGRWIYRTDTYQRSKRIAAAVGLQNIGNHGFRHTHATMLFEAGVDAKEIQERLGHSSITITMDTYTHLTKNNKTSTVDKLINHLNF